MATFIQCSRDAAPESEEILRKALLKHLRVDDVVLSGLRFHDHEYGDVEIDLLVLLPDAGAAVIEVKGGTVTYANGSWWTTGHDGTHQIDPAGQARRGLYSLRRFVERQPSWSRGKIRGDWFLAFPFTSMGADTDLGPEGRRETIFARGEEEVAAAAIWEILSRPSDKPMPGTGWVDQVLGLLRAEASGPITIEQRVAQRLTDINAKTQDQEPLLKMWRNNRVIEVVGGAGSGKTWLAMQQAQEWSKAGLRVAFLTYTKGVAEMVARSFADLPAEDTPAFIGTFHALGFDWGVESDPTLSAAPDYWTSVLPAKYQAAASGLSVDSKFDAIIVDEAQDFAETWWEVVWAAAKDSDTCRLAVFRDDAQALFANRLARPSVSMARIDLDANRRNGRQIVEAFAPLCDRRMEVLGGEGLPVRIVFAEADQIIGSADDAVMQLIEQEGWLPEHVALLTTKGRHPEHAERQDSDKERYWQSFLTDDSEFYGTVAGFKGLERPAIVIAINGFHDHAQKRDVMYTAMSRAIDLVVLVGTEADLTEIFGPKQLRRMLKRQ